MNASIDLILTRSVLHFVGYLPCRSTVVVGIGSGICGAITRPGRLRFGVAIAQEIAVLQILHWSFRWACSAHYSTRNLLAPREADSVAVHLADPDCLPDSLDLAVRCFRNLVRIRSRNSARTRYLDLRLPDFRHFSDSSCSSNCSTIALFWIASACVSSRLSVMS